MDYDLWVLSIYDEYKKEYEKQFPHKKFIDKLRELSILKKCILGIYFFGVFINMIFCIYGINKNNSNVVVLSLLIDLIITTIMNSQIKVDFQEYKKKLEIFAKVLEKEKLNDIELLKKIEKDTSGILNNLFNKINKENIEVISAIIQGIGIFYFIKKLGTRIIINIILFIIIVAFLIYLIYTIVTNIPNNKYTKKRDMNQLIKIYITYKNYK